MYSCKLLWSVQSQIGVFKRFCQLKSTKCLFYFAAKLVPVGYGIKKLQIQCVVEDDKVGTDMLEERITAFEDYVQSMDVAAFNKI